MLTVAKTAAIDVANIEPAAVKKYRERIADTLIRSLSRSRSCSFCA